MITFFVKKVKQRLAHVDFQGCPLFKKSFKVTNKSLPISGFLALFTQHEGSYEKGCSAS